MKLTKQQKKKYVKRSKLVIADRHICALIEQHDKIWTAIDKMPDGDIKTQFIKDAGLEQEQMIRVTKQIVYDEMRRTMEHWHHNYDMFMGDKSARIINLSTNGLATPFVPDEIDPKERV